MALWGSFAQLDCIFDQLEALCETIHQGQFCQVLTDSGFSVIISVFSAAVGLGWPAFYNPIPAGIRFSQKVINIWSGGRPGGVTDKTARTDHML